MAVMAVTVVCVGFKVPGSLQAPRRASAVCRSNFSAGLVSEAHVSPRPVKAAFLARQDKRQFLELTVGCRGLRRSGHTAFRVAAMADAASALEDEDEDGPLEIHLKVEGMTCGGCSTRVTEALKATPSVTDADVSLESGIATVKLSSENYIEALETLPVILKVVRDLGFEAEAQLD